MEEQEIRQEIEQLRTDLRELARIVLIVDPSSHPTIVDMDQERAIEALMGRLYGPDWRDRL